MQTLEQFLKSLTDTTDPAVIAFPANLLVYEGAPGLCLVIRKLESGQEAHYVVKGNVVVPI